MLTGNFCLSCIVQCGCGMGVASPPCFFNYGRYQLIRLLWTLPIFSSPKYYALIIHTSFSTAVGAVDFQAFNADMTFMAGMGNRVCRNLTVFDDAILEDDETFMLVLSTTDPDVIVDPTRERGTATIVDGDSKEIGNCLRTPSYSSRVTTGL